MKVFTGRGNPWLAGEICSYLGIRMGQCEISCFANENLFVKILENVRETDAFVIQPASPPVNEHLVEMLIMIDALKHASARRVTAVIPYYFYARSDKKDQPRISITARLVADLLQAAGADRLLTMNLHSPQIHGFFNIPVDHLLAGNILVDYFRKKGIRHCTVVAPDAGSAKRAEGYARMLKVPMAILDKRRLGNLDEVEILNIVGDVKGRNVIILDDEIATGGSLIETAKALVENGAKDIYAGAVHGVLCGEAVERIGRSPIKEVVVTNTVPVPEEKRGTKIRVLSVARLLGEAIRRIHRGESVSVLFEREL